MDGRPSESKLWLPIWPEARVQGSTPSAPPERGSGSDISSALYCDVLYSSIQVGMATPAPAPVAFVVQLVSPRRNTRMLDEKK